MVARPCRIGRLFAPLVRLAGRVNVVHVRAVLAGKAEQTARGSRNAHGAGNTWKRSPKRHRVRRSGHGREFPVAVALMVAD